MLGLSALGADSISGKLIANGTDFTGWEGETNKIWRIEEGAFVGGNLKEMGARNEFLVTTRQYTNFILRVKFKLVGTEGFVNGGVQIRSQRIKTPPNEMSGYQVDMGEPTWWGCLYDESRRNKVVAQSDTASIKKVLHSGGWNEYLIRCEGKQIQAWLNGFPTFKYTEADPEIPQFGYIGLQIHGGGKSEAWYKDIRIKELK